MLWVEKVRKHLREQITNAKEFNITKKILEKETKKNKNQTAPGIDGIQNFVWERLKPARRAQKKIFELVKDNNALVPVWWPS